MMNEAQKQRALAALGMWHSSNDDSLREYQAAELMAGLLQELVDAPEAEPVARVTGYYAGYLSIATVDGRVLPAGTALYAAPPAPSVPDGWRLVPETATVEMRNAGMAHLTGLTSYANSMALKVYGAMLAAAPTPAEAPADVARDAERYRWLRNQNNSLETQQRDKGVINGLSCYHEVEGIRELKYDKHLDCAVDAAIERGKLKGGA